MAICGVFHAVPQRAFGARLRTGEDLAAFLAGEHALKIASQLDVSDAWACLGALCEQFSLSAAMGMTPVRVPGTLATFYVPAYRLPEVAAGFDRVGPGHLAGAIDALATAAPADGAHWVKDKRALAMGFLQLKKFYRICADHGYDVLFVKRKGTPAHVLAKTATAAKAPH